MFLMTSVLALKFTQVRETRKWTVFELKGPLNATRPVRHALSAQTPTGPQRKPWVCGN